MLDEGKGSQPTESVQRSEEQLRWIADSIPSLIAYIDTDQRYRFTNAAYDDWFGHTPGSLIGRSVRDTLDPQTYRTAQSHIDEALTGRRVEYENDVWDKHGQPHRAHVVLTPHRERSGEILGFSALLTDVTERSHFERAIRHANAQLKRKHEEMEEFLSIIAHDLKQPVVGIRGLLSLLETDCLERLDPQSRENLEMSLAECDRMAEMLAQLSEFGRITRTRPKTERVHLAGFTRKCAQHFMPRPGTEGPTITIHAPDIEAAFARVQVEEALRNLLDNAVKYGCTEEDKRIDVTCSPGDDTCEISVADHGPGIDPKYHAKVFQLFRRMARREDQEGSGVGLAAVRRLMRRLGGDVALHSEPGKGACFTLKFPMKIDR